MPDTPITSEAGGVCRESSSMRLAQLPTACPARDALLQGSRPRIRARARHVRRAWIRCRAPQGAGEMAGGHGLRRRARLREMQSARASLAGVGPRPHRRPQVLDRPRTSKLQSKRRTAQSGQPSRAMALTSASAVRFVLFAVVARLLSKPLEDAIDVVVAFLFAFGGSSGESGARRDACETGIFPVRVRTKTPRGVSIEVGSRPPVRGLASSRRVQDFRRTVGP